MYFMWSRRWALKEEHKNFGEKRERRDSTIGRFRQFLSVTIGVIRKNLQGSGETKIKGGGKLLRWKKKEKKKVTSNRK